jgi:glyoxylate/hydroxypyruvate/2-ketogluconate reductase
MSKPELLMTCPAFPGIIEQLAPYFDVEATPDEMRYSEAQLIDRLAGKQAVFTAGNARFTANVLQQAPQLKVISAMTVGYDNIDLAQCAKQGIVVSNAPDVITQTTADFAWALLLATARRVTESEHWLRTGQWDKWQLKGFLGAEVHGKTLGILGMGRIGQAIARRSMGFDMQVLYHNRSRLTVEQEARANHARYVGKEQLLQQSDHLILMLPFTEETRHAMGAAEFRQMQPHATLINTARGGVVDDVALISALRNKQIAAAGLDVFENEPRLHPDFLTLSNVVLTPHIASASEPTRRAMQQCAVNNLIHFNDHGAVINLVQ